MNDRKDTAETLVRNMLAKWERVPAADEGSKSPQALITLCMEPGSGGSLVADGIAERLKLDLYHHHIVDQIAKSIHSSNTLIESLEKERLSGIEDFISSLVQDQYLHPDTYLEHLLKVVVAIGKHGRAVVVGRGSNFILPFEEAFHVRVVAPLEARIENVSRTHEVTLEAAKRRVLHRQSRRQAFVRQSFHADINDPYHYDLVINTGRMAIPAAVEAVAAALKTKVSSENR